MFRWKKCGNESGVKIRYKGLKQEGIPLFDQALSIYKKTKLDFVDCLLISRNALGMGDVFSFDEGINKYIRTHLS